MLQDRPDAWLRVATRLLRCQPLKSSFLALTSGGATNLAMRRGSEGRIVQVHRGPGAPE
jgi:hypothetical protein